MYLFGYLFSAFICLCNVMLLLSGVANALYIYLHIFIYGTFKTPSSVLFTEKLD